MKTRMRLITLPTVAATLCLLFLPPIVTPRHVLASGVQNGRIVFESGRPTPYPPGSAIFTVNPDGSGVIGPLTKTSDSTPAYSPDGTHIAWATSDFGGCEPGIDVMNVDGSSPYEVANRCVDFGSVNATPFFSPAWSPDGSKLAFVCTDPNTGAEDVCRVNSADGSGFADLTNNASSSDLVDHPSWSPDGTQIAYALSTNGGSIFQIHVMNADGSNDHAITPTSQISFAANPAWSPDGSRIAFTGLDSGSQDRIFLMNPDGTNAVQLTTGPGADRQPAWSPDGTKLAFISSRATQTYNIYTMNADGSQQTAVTNDAYGNEQPNWGTDTSGTTRAHVAAFGATCSRGHTTFSWRMAGGSDVLGFTLRAGAHVLTRHLISPHRAAAYRVVVGHTALGPYTLTAYLRSGGTVTATTG